MPFVAIPSADPSTPNPSPPKRLTTLFCVQSLEGGGAERQIAYLANALAQFNWDVHIVFRRPGPNARRIDRSRVTLHQLHPRRNPDPRLFGELLEVVQAVEPHVVLTWLPQMDTLGGACAAIAGIPWLLCERTSRRAYSLGVRPMVRRWIAKSAAAVIANSDSGASYWKDSPQPVFVVPNLVPFEEIEKASGLQPEHAAHSPTRTVLAVGRLVPIRNYPVLIRAWAEVWASSRARLMVLGEGPELERLKDQVRLMGLERAIEFVGFVDDVFVRMSRAAAYVSLSAVEGRPNATMEAAAVGCPLVLSDIPEHRDLFGAHEVSYVAGSDARRVAEAVLELLGRPYTARTRAGLLRSRLRNLATQETVRVYDRLLRSFARSPISTGNESAARLK